MTAEPASPTVPFGDHVARAHARGSLVVQPRMGMSRPDRMRAGLRATRGAAASTVGTITVDSYTRTGDTAAARRAVARGLALNGYPITVHQPAVTRQVLRGIADDGFPVQVRHGSARPEEIVAALLAAGLDATEGGPVSYCLPYSRVPLNVAVAAWERGCALLAEAQRTGARPHLETFGGCMMGQLCPPGLLIALSVLEALFFRQHGLRSVSLSYAQQANARQDEESVIALSRLAAALLPDVQWHIVVYAHMGMYPLTPGGARLLLREAARLAVRTGAARLIVKTTAEAHRIPTVAENVTALETAASAAGAASRASSARASAPPPVGSRPVEALPAGSPTAGSPAAEAPDTGIHAEASALIDAVLDLDPDIGRALVTAFARGYLDVPFCLHPDNAGRTRSGLDADGRLYWSAAGAMPLPARPERGSPPILGSDGLMAALSYVQRTFDRRARTESARHPRDPRITQTTDRGEHQT
ncbi:methylaspartate mutase [Streptomyces humi]|uniref:methylaspartate mutase n=1 Tax=Streptomyces humi TaxID=1428620 RepID=UPI0007C6C592|nr:methylaspartate mutase [Streptomyces humi]